jgi:hypothetical protein
MKRKPRTLSPPWESPFCGLHNHQSCSFGDCDDLPNQRVTLPVFEVMNGIRVGYVRPVLFQHLGKARYDRCGLQRPGTQRMGAQ